MHLKTYTIAPLRIQEQAAIVDRLRKYYAQGIFSEVLFSIYFVPEGNPPFDKAKDCAEAFLSFQKALSRIPVGILVNSLFGHGADRLCTPNAFQKQIGLDPRNHFQQKERVDVCCPLDLEFRKYVAEQFRQLASMNPQTLMIDDDFRIQLPVHGCLCPLHIKAFNEHYHFSMTEEELASHLTGTRQHDIEIASCFEKVNRTLLKSLMQLIRSTIDSVNPHIHGVECSGPNDISYLEENARIFAGANQTPEVRIGNACYLQQGNRNFPEAMHQTMLQKGLLASDVIVLSELDTFPHTRYSMGAREMHATYTGHLLEGCAGAKQWIMRLVEEETSSEKAYSAILAKYAPFYETIAQLISHITFAGPGNLYPAHMHSPWNPPCHLQEIQSWSTVLTGRMGLPVHFRQCGSGAGMLTASEIPFYSDPELKQQLNQGVILDGEAAIALTERGFSDMMGVSATPFPAGHRTLEEQLGTHRLCGARAGALMSPPAGQVFVRPLSTQTEVISWLVRSPYMRHPNKEKVSPGITLFQNQAGGKVIVFASSPNGLRGMAYFNETRKSVLSALMNELEPMAAFYPEDAEIYLKSGWLDSRTIFIALINLGCDPLTDWPLAIAVEVKSMEMLQPDGKFRQISFHQEHGQYLISTTLETMLPCILRIEVQKER